MNRELKELLETLSTYSWHNCFCSTKPNGVDGDCKCGYLKLQKKAKSILSTLHDLESKDGFDWSKYGFTPPFVYREDSFQIWDSKDKPVGIILLAGRRFSYALLALMNREGK